MRILTADDWQDYTLIDSGHEQRLERFGLYTLIRPDPQAIWRPHLPPSQWYSDAVFEKNGKNEGVWKTNKPLPKQWLLQYKEFSFFARLMPFKHTGIFPEQAAHWDWMHNLIHTAHRPINVLNLFGYTGITSLVCAHAGASVTHVDASKPAIAWAKENQAASNVMHKPIRWIVDDAIKFTQREKKRGVLYDAIIMDPPIYGHGPHGEVWDFNKSMPELLKNCRAILSAQPLFILIDAYAISSSSIMLQNILQDYFGDLHGIIEYGELAIKQEHVGRLLSTGIFGRWSRN